MKIGIYDTEHFETTVTLARILDNNEASIILFITPEIATALDALEPGILTKCTSVILKQGSRLNAYRVYRYCKRHRVDILFLNTVAFHHVAFGIFLGLLRGTSVGLTIHDANSFFKPKATPGLRGLVRARGKKLLAKAADFYITLLSSTKIYIEEHFRTSKPVLVMPGSLFEKASVLAPGSSLVIVVPGSIDATRRDYNTLFDALALLKGTGRSMEFVILGGSRDAAAKQIIARCKEFETTGLKITAYDSVFLSQQEYDRQLARADFIYAPLQKNFRFESEMAEVYGLTKSSGVFFDAVRFGKPLLIPARIHIPEELKEQSIVYHSAGELVSFLQQLTLVQQRDIFNKAIQNAEQFSLERIRERWTSFIVKK